jgi:hypothetical protein
MIVAAFVFAAVLPFVYKSIFFIAGSPMNPLTVRLLLIVVYVCYAPILTALFSLDRLLSNITKGDIFTNGNIRILRVISWACFAAAIILLGGAFISVLFCIMAVLIAFIGLIVRVVKNVMAAATELKNENDFTI